MNDDGSVAVVGYCGPAPENSSLELAARYHGAGHSSAVGAAECYRTWILDHLVKLHQVRPSGAEYPCWKCLKLTAEFVEVDGGEPITLCKRHQDMSVVGEFVPVDVQFFAA